MLHTATDYWGVGVGGRTTSIDNQYMLDVYCWKRFPAFGKLFPFSMTIAALLSTKWRQSAAHTYTDRYCLCYFLNRLCLLLPKYSEAHSHNPTRHFFFLSLLTHSASVSDSRKTFWGEALCHTSGNNSSRINCYALHF